jgi:glutamate-ammonia-ligase adenylyltransferase
MDGELFFEKFCRLLENEDPDERQRVLSNFLKSNGFLYGKRSADNILLMQKHFAVETLYAILTNSIVSPSPDLALNAFERLIGVMRPEELADISQNSKRLSQFIFLCGSSPFLVNLMFRDPYAISRLFLENDIEIARSGKDMLEILRNRVDGATDFNGLMRVLREFKRFEILRIASRDLCGLAPLEEVTAELSDLAASSLQLAYEVCRRCLTLEHGAPMMHMESGRREAEMTVIGMGKLGGRELNFSSDIDIIFFYESDSGESTGIATDSGAVKGILPLHSFFSKLAEMISKALSQVTEDGFVFRVDVGLRPEGKSGDMAVSLRSAEIYYESWGQSWERTAMLKARPVAGSIEFGERLLSMLKPFVYRKYLDYSLIDDMKNMKQKIDASLTRSMERETNLKLGRGGIREIEFFIQALQLVYAGKKPHLRERNSLQALDKLLADKLISDEDHLRLSDAYRFLRTVEHRIQVVQERQTHNLPSKEDELNALSRRCGFLRPNGLERFRIVLEEHRSNVATIYGNLFHNKGGDSFQELEPWVLFLLDRKADPDLIMDMLAERHFEDLGRAYENLMSLRRGPEKSHITPRNRRMLENIMPLMLREVFESPDPDLALINLERFLAVIGARSAYYALLSENHITLKLLMSLFGMSEFLSKILISHPELLESMVASSYASTVKSGENMYAELSGLLEQSDYFEDQLDVMRRYRNEEFLRIGMNDIHGKLKQGEITTQLTKLGETCLSAAYCLALQDLKRFGRPLFDKDGEQTEASLAVIGLGKLGGRELNYHSDLDIIFVYDHQGSTDGEKKITNHEYFAKLAQKIISILTMQTREGYVYKIDTRLRPSGNAGPLVTSLDSFLAYHRKEAQIWERQALTKARVVLGYELLAAQLNDAVSRTVYSLSIDDAGRSEINRLRMRMENELAKESGGNYNIKTGRGGMVDVEFAAQYLQLKYGCRFLELRTTSTIEVLRMVQALGLLPVEMAEQLLTGYKFLRKLENRLRIIHDYSSNDLSGSKSYLNKLARRLGYDAALKNPGAALICDYEEITGKIRNCYVRIMGGDSEERGIHEDQKENS